MLNESPGAGYIDRRWPEPFKETGAWPLSSLRQAFLTGAMERLVDVDSYLKAKVPEFVSRGDFGLASGQQPGGTYTRVWFNEGLPVDEGFGAAGDGHELRFDLVANLRPRALQQRALHMPQGRPPRPHEMLVALAGVVEDVDRFQPPRLRRIIQLAEMTERPLAGAIRRAHRFDKRPVGVPLAIFLAMIGAKKHWRRWSHARSPAARG